MFRWDTLIEIGSHDLHYKNPVQGIAYEIALIRGEKIRVWRAKDGQQYFCHGLTFGGKDAPGGPISPFSGEPVETILHAQYEPVSDEADARAGDILVWRGVSPDTTPHSAILLKPLTAHERNYLDEDTTELRTKNGMEPEADTLLESLLARYGDSYNIYRRR